MSDASIDPPPTPWTWGLAQLVLVATAGVTLGLSFVRVFESTSVLVVPSVASAVGAAIAVAVTSLARRWSPSATLLAALVLFPPVVALAVLRTAPTPQAMGDVVVAVPNGPARILSSPLPVAGRPELVVLVAAVVWLTVVLAGILTVRRRALLVPLIPFAVAAVLPALLGAGGRPVGTASMIALLALAGALTLVRSLVPSPGTTTSVRSRRARQRARILGGIPVLLVVAIGAPLLAPRLPLARHREPVDLRRVPSGAPTTIPDPLAQVNAELNLPRTEERFVVQADTGLSLFRTAVLDDYDGITFRPTLQLAPAGTTLPASSVVPPAGSRPVEQRIEIRSTANAFLPTAGIPTSVHGIDVRYDPTSTTLYADQPIEPGTVVTVDALVHEPTEDDLASARRDRAGPDTAQAGKPIDRAGLLARLATNEVDARLADETGSTDTRTLRALQAFFANAARFELSPQPRSGVALRQLTDFVTGTSSGGEATAGSSEQFAAAYAVMARTLGFATRVAVGYRASTPRFGSPYRITNRDALAWPEVKLEGLGWVPFVALPGDDDRAGPDADADAGTTTTTAPLVLLPPPPRATASPPPKLDEVAPAPSSTGLSPWLIGPGIVVGLIVALVLGTFAARRLRRRRRERGPDPAHRVLGAWREILDRLRVAGVPLRPSMTAAEVIETATATLGAEPVVGLDRLGTLVNRARFAPGGVAAEVADESWRLVGSVGRAVRDSRRGRVRRAALVGMIDPRAPRVR